MFRLQWFIVISTIINIKTSYGWIVIQQKQQTSSFSSSSSLFLSVSSSLFNNNNQPGRNQNHYHRYPQAGSYIHLQRCTSISNNSGGNNFFSLRQSTTTSSSTDFSIDDDDDDDDANARSQFGTKEYWDDLYDGRGEFSAEEYSWYFGWGEYEKFVKQHIPNKQSEILLPGVGNDPILLDLLQNGYEYLTATDYSQSAIDRQEDLLFHATKSSSNTDNIILKCMDARRMYQEWTSKFDAVLEKGALDAIYLSGDGNVELAAKELERVVKPGGKLISVSGVVPEELRRDIFQNWIWIRDGSNDLQAGCFVLQKPE